LRSSTKFLGSVAGPSPREWIQHLSLNSLHQCHQWKQQYTPNCSEAAGSCQCCQAGDESWHGDTRVLSPSRVPTPARESPDCPHSTPPGHRHQIQFGTK